LYINVREKLPLSFSCRYDEKPNSWQKKTKPEFKLKILHDNLYKYLVTNYN